MPDIKEQKPNARRDATARAEARQRSWTSCCVSMNATYIVRPDYIEITTFERRLEEKVTRVFPVADLVDPDPELGEPADAVPEPAVQNQQLAIFGQASLGGGGLPGHRRQRSVAASSAAASRRWQQSGGQPGGGIQGGQFGNRAAQIGTAGQPGVRRRRRRRRRRSSSASSATSAASSASRAATRAGC